MDILAESFFDISIRFRALIKNGHLEEIRNCKKNIVEYVQTEMKELVFNDEQLVDILVCLYGVGNIEDDHNFSLLQSIRDRKVKAFTLSKDKIFCDKTCENVSTLETLISNNTAFPPNQYILRNTTLRENCLKSLNYLFTLSKKYGILVNNIDHALSLSEKKFNENDIDVFVNNSIFLLYSDENEQYSEYIKFLSPYEIYIKCMHDNFNDKTEKKINEFTAQNSLHGFIIDFSSPNFSLDSALLAIKSQIERLSFRQRLMKDSDIIYLNKQHYGSKGKKDLLNVFLTVLLWDKVKIGKSTQRKTTYLFCEYEPFSFCTKNCSIKIKDKDCKPKVNRYYRNFEKAVKELSSLSK